MKEFVLLFLTLLSAFSTYLLAQRYENVAKINPCPDFHKKSCLHLPDEGFAYNAQSHSSLFVKGQQSGVKVVFFRGMDYHISVCTEDKSPANFIIKDAKTGEILYNNAKDNYTEEIQISNENTRNVKIEITLIGKADAPAPKAENDKKKDGIKDPEEICTGILIEHRRSDKNGF